MDPLPFGVVELVEAAFVPTAVVARDGTVFARNEAARALAERVLASPVGVGDDLISALQAIPVVHVAVQGWLDEVWAGATLHKRVAAEGGASVVHARLAPVRGADGEVVATLASFEILDAEARTSQARRDGQAYFQALLDAVDIPAFVINVAGDGTLTFERLNAAHERLTGMTTAWIRGRRPDQLVPLLPREAATAVEQRYRACVEAGEPIQYEECLPFEGQPSWWLTRLTPLRDDLGRVYRIVGTALSLKHQKAHEAQLEAAKADAEGASAAKSTFLATMSHEIRQPMNGVLGYAELLDGTPLAPEQRGYVDAIRHGGEMMLQLLSDLLDLSQAEADALTLAERPFDLRELVQRTTDMHGREARRKGLVLTHHVVDDLPVLWQGDPVRVGQVLWNLVGNAVKYTEVGTVHVEVGGRDGALVLEVTDTGPGIGDDEVDALFEPFRRGSRVAHGGVGLGLPLTRKLAILMGGSLDLRPGPGGRGTSFRVLLKLHATDVAAPTPARPRRAPAPVDDLTALVVEDHPVNQELVGRMLQRLGVASEIAADGPAALAFLAGQSFDLVLMDVSLPGMDGLEVTRRLRKRLGDGPLVVALTARASEDDRRACLDAGMDRFLTKPVSLADLADVMRAAADRRRAR